MRFLCKTNNIKSITTICTMVVMLVLLATSCGKEKTEVVEVAFDPEATYTMKATNITDLISDSGVIRYRVIADVWYDYAKAAEPYWFFPEKGYAERLDSLLNVELSIQADTIYFFYKKDLWELVGNVKVLNLKGERFDTEHLFWDVKNEKAYSEAYIRVENEDKIITGIGFESNLTMTKYDVFNSQGIFPVKDTPVDTTGTNLASDSIIVMQDLDTR